MQLSLKSFEPVSFAIFRYQGIELDPEVKAVVIGLDPRLTYRLALQATMQTPNAAFLYVFVCSKLAIAAAYLARPHVEFVACNTDSTFPAIPGLKLPGAGRFCCCNRPRHRFDCSTRS